MNIFKKIIEKFYKKTSEEKVNKKYDTFSLDDSFAHQFIKKGGKFLYATEMSEVYQNIRYILAENNWKELICTDYDLLKIINPFELKIHSKLNNLYPFFTTCEYLIADSGEILFTSNQLNNTKINDLSFSLIVYATTSQIVKNINEGLANIEKNYHGNIPTNISFIEHYAAQDKNYSMNYENNSSKNLYLLLFEDL